MPSKIVKKQKKERTAGFTIIEIMVSITLFLTILVISSGSILSIFDANRKSQSLRSVMDNLNYTLEAMARNIRFGTNYHCDDSVQPVSDTRDCATGAGSIVFKDYLNTETRYKLSSNSITISTNGGASYASLTSPEITITDLKFRVLGSTTFCATTCGSKDVYQPRVIINLSGYVGSKISTRSNFSLQTTVSQRVLDAKD